jgi:hypothetical protein
MISQLRPRNRPRRLISLLRLLLLKLLLTQLLPLLVSCLEFSLLVSAPAHVPLCYARKETA